MITVKLMGGLGNQLFQYAAGRRLALLNNAEMRLDLSSFYVRQKSTTVRHYELQRFNIQATWQQPARFERVLLRLPYLSSLRQKMLLRGMSCVKEKYYHFDPTFLKLRGNIYLDGYWQSYKYFEDIRSKLLAELTLNTLPSDANFKMAREIEQSESVVLHVRRGDYITNTQAQKFHGVCGIDYYQQAIEAIQKKIVNPHFFVFSDDPAWTQEHIKISSPTTYVTHNLSNQGYEDLRLMNKGKHFIIANSSFSWWGAWLSRHKNKIVYAPRRWFADESINTNDLIPSTWHRI